MRRRYRGVSVIVVASIALVVMTLQLYLITTLNQSGHRLRVHKLQQVAKAQAVSGLDYAEGRMARETWTPPPNWRSPGFHGAWFELRVVRQGGSTKIISTGIAGGQRFTAERRL